MVSRRAIPIIAAVTSIACEDPSRTVAPALAGTDLSASVSTRATYSIADLGTLGGTNSWADEVNDEGLVVGASETASGAMHAFVWIPGEDGQRGAMLDLGSLPGWDCSEAFGINRRGDIVGYACKDNLARPVRWKKQNRGSDYVIEELAGLGGHKGSANAINDRGDVAGNSCTVESITHAMQWSRIGGMRDLGIAGGSSAYAADINEKGEMVIVGDLTVSYFWSEKAGFRNIGNLGGTGPETGTIARALNSRGEAVGWSSTREGAVHAFAWSERSGMLDLGTLGGALSFAMHINNAGDIAGVSETETGTLGAFIWTRERGLQGIGSLVEGGYSDGWGISDRGQIAGAAETADGQFHAVLYTPSRNMENMTMAAQTAATSATKIARRSDVTRFSLRKRAEGEGFEPPSPFGRQFSRLVH